MSADSPIPASDSPACALLEWDSNHFGARIARVNAGVLNDASLAAADRWCKEHDIACAYFFCGVADPVSPRVAGSGGFHLVDIRTTFERSLDNVSFAKNPAHADIRAAREDDVAELERIAAASHHDTRFYFDPHFERSACDRMYERWIRTSCGGYADAVFVPEIGGRAAGYVSCHLDPGGRGRIGLLAVGEPARGRGLGANLVQEALKWFLGKNATLVSVVTQGRNIPAQRFYQRCGFRTRQIELAWHKWY